MELGEEQAMKKNIIKYKKSLFIFMGSLLILIFTYYHKPIEIYVDYPAVMYKEEMYTNTSVELKIIIRRQLFSKDRIDGSILVGDKSFLVSNNQIYHEDDTIPVTDPRSLSEILREKIYDKTLKLNHRTPEQVPLRVEITKDYKYLYGSLATEEETKSFIAPAKSREDVLLISKILFQES